MSGIYLNCGLMAKMAKIGTVDRFFRFGPSTWEAFVTLSLTSDHGLMPEIKMALHLLWNQDKVGMHYPLASYSLADANDAHNDALVVCGRLGIGLLYSDADRKWQTLADPDTATVVIPGSIVLWED